MNSPDSVITALTTTPWHRDAAAGTRRAAPSDVSLRPAGPDDARAIGDVFLASRTGTQTPVYPPFSDAETRAYLAELIGNPRYAVWVAERHGQVVGFLALCDDWLDQLHVHPALYRNRIGTMLLDCAKRLSPMGLRVFCYRCDGRARAFYAAGELVAVGRADGSAESGGEADMEYRWSPAG